MKPSLLIIVACLLVQAQEPTQTTVTGIVVALGQTAVRDDDRCRQLMVVRTTGRGNGKLKNTYLLVARNYDCDAGHFKDELFLQKRKWRFPVIRSSGRPDVTFEQIKDFRHISPGGQSWSEPWMHMVPGNGGEKMPPTQKLLSYEINGEAKPAK